MDTILIYVLVVALFATIPEILDIFLAYRSQNKMRIILIEKASLDKLTLNELKEFVKESGKAPPGIPGLSRAIIALTVILILGIAVFHLLLFEGSPMDKDNSQIVNNVLIMLAGLLAAITGFYFGGRAVEKKEEPEEK